MIWLCQTSITCEPFSPVEGRNAQGGVEVLLGGIGHHPIAAVAEGVGSYQADGLANGVIVGFDNLIDPVIIAMILALSR